MDFPIPLDDLERGRVSDGAVRALIRYGCQRELAERARGGGQRQAARLRDFVRTLRAAPIAADTSAANRQHYEVPAAFFQAVLGKHLKYSCGYWPGGSIGLDEAEEAMLRLICERARLADGQAILDLGCGWGALALYLAQRYPWAHITGLSSSHSQKAFIDRRARERGLGNLDIVTADASTFEFPRQFDRVVSVELFEHLRNHELLLARLARWMRPDALLFVHVFAHARYAYFFEANWMAEHFFTGGLMPSDGLLPELAHDFAVLGRWRLDGWHYQKTSEAWLANLDRHRDDIRAVFHQHYGAEANKRLWMWRLFFLVCAESFGYDEGREWGVSHYLFGRS
jgi:cyclopropane-fatty-acyl-phospholipid synthase